MHGQISNAAILMCAALVADAQTRTWTDVTGRFKVEADLVTLDGQRVTLRKAVGSEKELLRSQLCEG